MMLMQEIIKWLGAWGFTGAVAATVYWTLQKLFEDRLAKRLESYRHSLATSFQNEQTRLELYNRRFEIFSSLFDFYEAMISWKGSPEHVAARARFFRAYQESNFLFRADSGIPALLKHLNEQSAKVIGFKENSELFRPDPEVYIRMHEETTNIQTKIFEDGLSELKVAIGEYLNFHNLDARK